MHIKNETKSISNQTITNQKQLKSYKGVSPDMAREIGRRLGLDIKLIAYPSPGHIVDDAPKDVWDIGNIGSEPARAKHMNFSQPYCEIECVFMVRKSSSIVSIGKYI